MNPQPHNRDHSRTRTARQTTVGRRTARAIKHGFTVTRSGRIRPA